MRLRRADRAAAPISPIPGSAGPIGREDSLVSRGIEDGILDVTRELGIGLTAYGVLSRGLISGHAPRIAERGDFRAFAPRFQGENLRENLRLADAIAATAAQHRLTAAQAAIAWVLAKGQDIVPLVGAMAPDVIDDLERAVPKGAAAGERYPAAQMGVLDARGADPVRPRDDVV